MQEIINKLVELDDVRRIDFNHFAKIQEIFKGVYNRTTYKWVLQNGDLVLIWKM